MRADSKEVFIERARKTRSLVTSLDLGQDIADLAPLDAIVGEARVVGIGESWHSARQLLQFRHRIVRYLVERSGFNLLIFEGSFAGAEFIDRYIKGGEGNAPSLLRHFEQAMWLNQETVEFMTWLRQHNARCTPLERVSICGMDIAPPTAALLSITAFLQRVDPKFVVPAADLVNRFAASCQAIPLSSAARAAIWGATEAFEKLHPAERAHLRSTFITIVSRLGELRKTYEAASSKEALCWITRHALMAVQACDVLAARLSSPREANHLRDLAFSENVAWLLDHGHAGSKAVLFGHNIHMAKEPFRSFDSEHLVPSLGERLARWYGLDYIAIGSCVGTGRLSGVPGMVDVPTEANARRESSLHSIDAALETLGEKQFLLPMTTGSEWTEASQPMRSHLQPTTGYTPVRAFDALAYVDGITPATPLPN